MIFLTLSFLLYFAPALLATSRRNPNATAIWLTNLFVGWTVIGWVITLIWALSTPPAPPLAYVVPVGGAGVNTPYPPPVGNPHTREPMPTGASSIWSAVPTVAPAADSVDLTQAARSCVLCGRPLPPNARFCPACGSVESRLG